MIKHRYRHWETFYKAVLLVLVFLLASEPVLVAAQPEQVDPRQETIQSLTASGDVYLTNVAEALSLSAGLVNSVSAIQSTPITQISENAILQTRADALKAAEASAVTLGSIDDLATSVQSLGDNLPAAFDPLQRAGEGLPQELRDDLTQELGLTSADVDAISAGMDDLLLARQDMAANGMPSQIAAQLTQAGFTQSEIDQIAQVAGNRGLANTTLTTSLAQFRASQDEWANVRTQMLILNLQLMGYQIGVRQAGGIEPRAVTEAELQAIAEDELRLLVHVAHLQELWGSDPNLEIGEGDWWFIEHYAGRAAERLDALIIETQNRGLVPDLFVLQEMRLLALSARNGDANYVKAELDGLGELLSFLVGDETFISRQREDLNGLTYVAARFVSYPSIREKVQWPLAETEKTYAAKRAKLRMDMVSVENLVPLYGLIAEQNELNNIRTLLFMAGLPYFGQVTADIVAAATSILSQVTPENYVIWVTAILTGETDNPVLIAANIGWSLIPVLGVIPDIYSLAVDPSIFVKALSIVGIVGSIGDLIALIPFMQGVGGASFLGDAAAAVIKALFKQADVVFRAILNGLKLADAFDVIIDFLKVTAHYVGSSIGSNLDEAIQFLSGLFTGTKNLWGSFVAFVKRVGVDLLLKLGFDEGSLLVGRILNLGVDLSDEALVALKGVSDDLVAAGVDLSDEAAEGLGKLARSMEPVQFQRFMNTLGNTCSVGMNKYAPKRAKLRTSGVCDPDLLQRILTSFKRFDTATLATAEKLAQKLKPEDVAALLSKYAGNPDDLAHVKSVFSGLEKAIANPKYGTEAVELAKSASDVDIPKLGKYLDEISSIDLAAMNVKQGFEVSKLAMEKGKTVNIAGRWADTPAEIALRKAADTDAQRLWADYMFDFLKNPPDFTKIPDWAEEFLIGANRENAEKVLDFVAKYETANFYKNTRGFNIEWYQVKVSSGGPEVDVFMDGFNGQKVPNEMVIDLYNKLEPIFNVTNAPKAIDPLDPEVGDFIVDFYNNIDLEDWMIGRSPNPAVNTPPGVVNFLPDGSIEHAPIYP